MLCMACAKPFMETHLGQFCIFKTSADVHLSRRCFFLHKSNTRYKDCYSTSLLMCEQNQTLLAVREKVHHNPEKLLMATVKKNNVHVY